MKEEKRIRQTFSEEERLEYLCKFYESGFSQFKFAKINHIKLTTFQNWVKKYSKDLPLPKEIEKEEMAKNNIPNTEMSLKKRINELEQALEVEKMRARSFEIMIDIAEKELNIPIKKKSGPNQWRRCE